ncbi:MAG: ABC transporter permease subunit [Pseudomonadota bacterium]|nr:ABC transporter permease subunit [Pseudomonadota bacterium]MEC7983149.1 ABC transporter permease subunit [Pseudomonadota bacterium]MEC8129039.1 ABC transporter permease subunit [Pseudomonadota bacterium]MEC8516084.1 ABC transporter permease subunit [Pseudomonadota bacterium]MEC8550067.1 ABC transporter permease subunit [Pseudomonadota bacterium]
MGQARQFMAKHGRRIVVALPLLWLLVFFLLPLVEVAQTSFTTARRGIPPFAPLWGYGDEGFYTNFNLENYGLLVDYWQDYIGPAANSLRLAFFSTLICLVFAYPMAWWIARSNPRQRAVLLVLVMLPFWTSSLLRIYALIGLLNPNGFINSMLLFLGVIDTPLRMMQTDFSIYMGMLLTYLPLMILPLYAVMIRLEDDILDAAADLGATRWDLFRTVVLPLTIPGIIAGSLLVFIPAVGEFVIPALLGGPEQVMIGKVLWTEFFRNRDWPVASAIAMLLLAILALPIIYARYQDGRETALDRAGGKEGTA